MILPFNKNFPLIDAGCGIPKFLSLVDCLVHLYPRPALGQCKKKVSDVDRLERFTMFYTFLLTMAEVPNLFLS